MTTTDPAAALAEALEAAGCVPSCAGCGAEIAYHADCDEGDGTLVWEVDAAAILAALPPDWCGHIGVEEAIAQGQNRIAALDARIVDLNGEVLALMAEIARLRKIEEAARPLARRTYVDDVVAHVRYNDIYRLRLAIFGSDEAIPAGLDALEAEDR
jgi:hypothetical protein